MDASDRRRRTQDPIGGVGVDGVVDDFAVDFTDDLLHPLTSANHAILKKWLNSLNALRTERLFELALARRGRSVD